MPEETEVLYVVHAQGPDDLYAAASKGEAEDLASRLNEQVPMAKCIVVSSPGFSVQPRDRGDGATRIGCHLFSVVMHIHRLDVLQYSVALLVEFQFRVRLQTSARC